MRGFDDAEKAGKRKQNATQKKRTKERATIKPTDVPPKEENHVPLSKLSPVPPDGVTNVPVNKIPSPIKEQETANDAKSGDLKEQPSLDLEDIFKCESLTGFYTNGVGAGDATGGSRFSQWFNREETPIEKHVNEESRRSSLQEENHHHHLIKNLLSDISEPNVAIPCDTEAYFAPISPAANTGNLNRGPAGSQTASKPVDLMEMLQRGKQNMPIAGDVPPVLKNPVGE